MLKPVAFNPDMPHPLLQVGPLKEGKEASKIAFLQLYGKLAYYMSDTYISPDKKKDLEAELAELKGPKRQEVLDALSFARSLGDLSENAEYHNARDEQARLEERIAKIEEVLRNSVIVTKHSTAAVSVGSVVTVKKKGDKESRVFTIVGGEEADMATGKISNNSPIGAALMGKKKGDVAIIKTPKGETEYAISDIK